MVILDTNHISVVEHRSVDADRLFLRLSKIQDLDVCVTVISYEEQIRGWMAAIAATKNNNAQVGHYARLLAQLQNYCNLRVLPYSLNAANRFVLLRKEHRRLSSPDLKIAAITLDSDAVLLTQNLRDFRAIKGLKIADWTVEETH